VSTSVNSSEPCLRVSVWGWQLLKVVYDVACTKIQSNYRGVLVRPWLSSSVLGMDKVLLKSAACCACLPAYAYDFCCGCQARRWVMEKLTIEYAAQATIAKVYRGRLTRRYGTRNTSCGQGFHEPASRSPRHFVHFIGWNPPRDPLSDGLSRHHAS
jgi:hypothetical protein